MSTIDLGDNPVGSTPTDAQKTQLRSSIGLGAADSVEFGGFIPPAGTTAEINQISDASVGEVMIDTNRNVYVRFTGSSTYETIGKSLESSQYFVDPQNGSDSAGIVGTNPFATINAALKQAVSDGASPIVVNCMAGTYSEEDAFDGVTVSGSTTVSILFDLGCVYNNPAATTALFNLASPSDIASLKYVGGNLTWIAGDYGFFNGFASVNTTILELESVPVPSTQAPVFSVLGGSAVIKIAGKVSNVTSTVVSVEGFAKVKCEGLTCESSGGFFSPSASITSLSGNASLDLIGVTTIKAGLCEITSDSACKLVLNNCRHTDTSMASPKKSVSAPSGSTQPQAYALGSNATDVAASDITIDSTFGTFVVNASAVNLI